MSFMKRLLELIDEVEEDISAEEERARIEGDVYVTAVIRLEGTDTLQ